MTIGRMAVAATPTVADAMNETDEMIFIPVLMKGQEILIDETLLKMVGDRTPDGEIWIADHRLATKEGIFAF